MLAELNWQTLAARRRLPRLTMFYKIHYNLVIITMPLSSKLYSCSTRTENILAYHPDVTTTCTRSSLGPSETGIHYHNKLSNFVLLRLLNKPSLLLEVNSGYWVGSSDPTQRSWTMFLTCTCTCTCTTVPSRSLYQAALHFHWVGWHCNCVILMLRSFHPIEVVGILQRREDVPDGWKVTALTGLCGRYLQSVEAESSVPAHVIFSCEGCMQVAKPRSRSWKSYIVDLYDVLSRVKGVPWFLKWCGATLWAGETDDGLPTVLWPSYL